MSSKTFGDLRKAALVAWRDKTGRQEETDDESIYNNAYECDWQNLLWDENEEYHNSFFCSLGEFASSIDDILSDDRFDEKHVSNGCLTQNNQGTIYRFCCRLLLVVEQVIEDFEEALATHLFPLKARILKTFINEVIKHRSNYKFHFNKQNHHCQVTLGSSGADDVLGMENYGTIDSWSVLELPFLSEIVDIVVDCYEALDQELRKNYFWTKFNKKYVPGYIEVTED